MGFLSEIKKLLFVNKSIAKSAADKSVDYAKDKGGELLDKSADMVGDVSGTITETATGLRDAIFEKGSDIIDQGKDSLETITETLGENEMVQKAGAFTESVGEKVMDKGGEMTEKFGEVSESVGAKVLDVKDKLVEKAQEVTGKLGEKLDETMEKAEAFHAEEAKKHQGEFAEHDLNAKGSLLEGSLLEGTDSFFDKADKFADGDHGAFSEGKITIQDDVEKQIKDPAKAAGFTDLDGDGNELIDDAIIEEE